jgi:hypothetical protein
MADFASLLALRRKRSYFPTKEALLLELLDCRLGRWLGDVESRLESETVLLDPNGAAPHIASTLLAEEDLVRLLMILGAVWRPGPPSLCHLLRIGHRTGQTWKRSRQAQ